MIKLQFIGHLGADAIRRETNGEALLSFSAAHSFNYRSPDGVLNERTTWIDCAYWGGREALLPFLTKGRQVFVEGFPSLDVYIPLAGEPKPVLKLRVVNLKLLASPRHIEEGIEESKAVDDLPF